MYYDFYNSLLNDPQFKDDIDKHGYCRQVIYTNYLSRPPTMATSFIVIGYEGARVTKQGTPQSTIFIATPSKQDPKQLEIKAIVCRANSALKYQTIQLWSGYGNVQLGSFGQGSPDFIADDRTKFENPRPLKFTLQQLIEEKLNIKQITISEAMQNPSKTDSKGYTIRSDLRRIKGIILGSPTIFKDKNSDFMRARCTLADMSVTPTNTINEQGTLQQTRMTIWLAPELAIADDKSEIEYIGTVALNKEKTEASMNAIAFRPIHLIEYKPTEQTSEQQQ